MEDYRQEGLNRFVEEELVPWLHNQGFIKPDYEDLGKILCKKYEGESDKFNKLSERASNTIKEAQQFLDNLKNK